MNSNLRVIKHNDDEGTYYSIQEVLYDDAGMPVKHSEDYGVQSETIDGLDYQIDLLEDALQLDVLEEGHYEDEDGLIMWNQTPTPEEEQHNLEYWKTMGLDIQSMVKSTPNNMELGKKIRAQFIDDSPAEQLELEFDEEPIKTID